jgi:hypothetical protein
MRKIKATAVIVVLTLAGMVYAAGQMQETKNAPDKEKAAACCSMSGESCCAKGKCCDKSAGTEACCKSDKEGAACCAAVTKDGQACANHSCCKAATTNHSSQACAMDGTGCCANCGDCSNGCCKAKVAKQ